MATINNPFVMYGYKGAEYFCDREKETEKMMTSLHQELGADGATHGFGNHWEIRYNLSIRLA